MPHARGRNEGEAPPATSPSLPLADGSPLTRSCRFASEGVLLALVCLSPWAFGSVEARAGSILMLGVALVAVLGTIADWGWDRARRFSRLPGLAIAGLALLAWVQSAPLPGVVLRRVDPAAAAARSDLLPERGVRVVGDLEPPVGPPRAAISRDPEATRNEAARLLAAWLLFQGVLGLGGGTAPFRRFGVAVTLNATLLALFALIQWLTWTGKIYGIVPASSGYSGPFICHNHLAATLNIGLGFALGQLLAPRRGGSRLWSAYAASVIVVGILASQSRSGFLGMLTASAVAVVALRPSVRRLAAGLAAILALVVAFQSALAISAPLERVSTLLEGKPFAERREIWGEVVRAWPSAPWCGMGVGSFTAATAPFIRHDRGEFYAHAENDYVEWLVEGGLVGLGLVLLGLGATLRHAGRALRATRFAEDRGLLAGGLFGVTAVATQCLGDFPMHIPSIALTAIVLAGHLARLGLEASGPPTGTGTAPGRARRLVAALVALATVAASLWLVAQAARLAQAEAALAGPGVLSMPGEERPTSGPLADSRADLELMPAALEQALRDRPDWAEGHLRLGLVHLSLYTRTTAEWIAQAGGDPDQVARMSEPLALHWRMHEPSAEGRPTVADLLAYEPVRLHLIPAARSFLEARRCCPTMAPAHAELADLDYLLEGGPPSSTHVMRALRWAGSDTQTIARVARIAVLDGAPDLAARCWRKELVAQDSAWAEVADMAAGSIPTESILKGVLPNGRLTLQFAERLYAAPDRREDRDRFLRAALERLPTDADRSAAERLHLQGRAFALLGDQNRSRARFEAALGAEPRRAEWRGDLVNWLIRWGRLDQAHDQAVLGLHFAPEHPETQRALKAVAEALARGPSGAEEETP